MDGEPQFFANVGPPNSFISEIFLSCYSSILGPVIVAVWHRGRTPDLASKERVQMCRLALAGEFEAESRPKAPLVRTVSTSACTLVVGLFNVSNRLRTRKCPALFDLGSGDVRFALSAVFTTPGSILSSGGAVAVDVMKTASLFTQATFTAAAASTHTLADTLRALTPYNAMLLGQFGHLTAAVTAGRYPPVHVPIMSSFMNHGDHEGSEGEGRAQGAGAVSGTDLRTLSSGFWGAGAGAGAGVGNNFLAKCVHGHIMGGFHTIIIGSKLAETETMLDTLSLVTPPELLTATPPPLDMEAPSKGAGPRLHAAAAVARALDIPSPGQVAKGPAGSELLAPAAAAMFLPLLPWTALQAYVVAFASSTCALVNSPLLTLNVLLNCPHATCVINIDRKDVYLYSPAPATRAAVLADLAVVFGQNTKVPPADLPPALMTLAGARRVQGEVISELAQRLRQWTGQRKATFDKVATHHVSPPTSITRPAQAVVHLVDTASMLPPSAAHTLPRVFLRGVMASAGALTVFLEEAAVQRGAIVVSPVLDAGEEEIQSAASAIGLSTDEVQIVVAAAAALNCDSETGQKDEMDDVNEAIQNLLVM